MEHFRQTNLWLVTAGALMTLTVFIHIFAGGPEVLAPTRTSDLDPVVISVLSVIWHGVTWILTLIAVTLFYAARQGSVGLIILVSVIQIGFAVLFLAYGLIDLGTLWPMPQWVIFLTIPALSLIGILRERTL